MRNVIAARDIPMFYVSRGMSPRETGIIHNGRSGEEQERKMEHDEEENSEEKMGKTLFQPVALFAHPTTHSSSRYAKLQRAKNKEKRGKKREILDSKRGLNSPHYVLSNPIVEFSFSIVSVTNYKYLPYNKFITLELFYLHHIVTT